MLQNGIRYTKMLYLCPKIANDADGQEGFEDCLHGDARFCRSHPGETDRHRVRHSGSRHHARQAHRSTPEPAAGLARKAVRPTARHTGAATEKLKDETFLTNLRALHADLQIVVAFRMLPEVVWDMPRLGTFNLHAALLPQYRGAAPINWAIINGDTQTGITTFFLDHDIDTGKVIRQEAIPIGPDDNAEDVHDRLMMLGADLVCQTVHDICNGTIHPIPQEQMTTSRPLRPAPKIFRDTCQIHWDRHTAQTAHNFVRGLSPYPGAWTNATLPDGRETTIKILATKVTDTHTSHDTGGTALFTSQDNRLLVRMPGGTLEITQLQVAGKKRMTASDFLNGTDIHGWSLA